MRLHDVMFWILFMIVLKFEVVVWFNSGFNNNAHGFCIWNNVILPSPCKPVRSFQEPFDNEGCNLCVLSQPPCCLGGISGVALNGKRLFFL